jgi:hypothetical protein
MGIYGRSRLISAEDKDAGDTINRQADTSATQLKTSKPDPLAFVMRQAMSMQMTALEKRMGRWKRPDAERPIPKTTAKAVPTSGRRVT